VDDVRSYITPNTSLQLVWFLAPTVALAEQQHHVLRSQLPAFQLRLLLGADKVELWSEKHIWDSVFLNVRIVVSTHQVCWKTMSLQMG
jgi:RecG-like helicase